MSTILTLNREKPLDPEAMRFDLDKPSFLKWLIIILLGIALNSYWILVAGYVIGLIVTCIVVIFSAILWNKIGFRILSKTVMREFDSFNTKYHRNKDLKKQHIDIKSNRLLGFTGKIILKLIGFELRKENEYYIEAEVNDIHISSIKDIFKLRLKDVLSSCIGLSMIIGFGLKFIILELEYIEYTPDLQFDFIFYFIIVSPIFVFWLIPVIWVFEDAQVRTIEKDAGLNSDVIVDNIRQGILGKLLGYGGILFGITYLMDIAEELAPEDFAESFLYQLTWAVIILIFFGFALSGTAYLTSALYLSAFHEKNVNRFRKGLSNYIPIGVTVIKLEEVPKIKPRETSAITDTIVCSCGFINPPHDKFCQTCGNPLPRKSLSFEKYCIKCGYERSSGMQRFCKSCGRKFT